MVQQVVKNFLLTNERTIERKIKEAILAYRISKEISKDINLGTTYKSPGEASEALEKFLKSKGIKYYNFNLERVKPKDNDYLDKTPAKSSPDLSNFSTSYLQKVAAGEHPRPMIDKEDAKKELAKRRNESVSEAPLEMDPSDPMDPMIYGHDKANPAKLKYRMLRAAGQLKDLAARAENASPGEWQIMARQFEELKMNMEQIRHALEELGKIKSKGGIRSRGITV